MLDADTPLPAPNLLGLAVPPADRPRLLPLAYFPIDEGYHVPARLAPSSGETSLDMPTSTGQRRKMRRAGQLRFSVKGQPLTLTAFVEADDRVMQRLFVPFGDPTNGTETYIGGRYLDLDRTTTGLYDLDFNRITASASLDLLAALTGDQTISLHAPAPNGLLGGYPVQVSRKGIVVDALTLHVIRRLDLFDAVEADRRSQ